MYGSNYFGQPYFAQGPSEESGSSPSISPSTSVSPSPSQEIYGITDSIIITQQEDSILIKVGG